MRKKIEEEEMTKLNGQFSNEWAQKDAVLKNELVVEKATLKRVRKKVQSKVDGRWNFIKSQRAGSFTTPSEFIHNEYAGDDETDDDSDNQYDTPNLGDG